MAETYIHTVACTNCGIPNLINIPKGELIKEATVKLSCTNCGCIIKQAGEVIKNPNGSN